MLRHPGDHQHELEFVCIEQLVPSDHLLRKISATIRFDFIRERVAHLYCADNGRPALDPVVLFKILFLGYLFGIRSERRLMEEIAVNLAYRWFLGLGLTDKVPDHSTLSQNRRRRFLGNSIYQQIFDEIVLQAIGHHLIDGRELFSDSTHLKANANNNKFHREEVARSTRDYLEELENDVNKDRKQHGKPPLPPAADSDGKGPARPKVTRISTTDPESGYMKRDGKPEGFGYLEHRTVDGKNNLITDSYVTPGNVHDSVPYLARLDRQTKRFNFQVEAVALDSGYYTAAICHGLEKRNIFAVMGYTRVPHRPGFLHKRDFVYDEHFDCYLCPQDEPLNYQTTGRDGNRLYASNPKICAICPLRDRCTTSRTGVKTITRHVWQEAREAVDARRLDPEGKRIYSQRQHTVERSFADSKQLHGLRYAKMRGLCKVAEQCLLSAACQNMKKIALVLTRIAAAAAKVVKTAAEKADKSPGGGPGKAPVGKVEPITHLEAASGSHAKIIWLERAIAWMSPSGIPTLAAA
jgi:transposase